MNKAHQARVARVDEDGRRVMLVQPQTFMNLSGETVAGLVGYHRVLLERVLVVVDDADLPLGTIRMRSEGSAGGHHGLESIEGRLGTRHYARQRIGIGRRREGAREITGHVLGRFSDGEWGLMERVMERAVEQVLCWLREGARVAMGRFNGMVEQTEQEASE
jgi:PTH1 family peptidyl-tRNA hydrolase